tara:strand:+ start:2035 stop:2388 length:354 start_codon:yes stop_codon:yes gene_type:complete
MIDTDKYENMRQLFLDFIDIGEDEPQWKRNLEIYDDLLAEVKRLQYWDEEMDRVIAHLTKHNWDSGDGDVHGIVEYILDENKQLRGLLDAIHWDAFAEDDTTLEIDREVAERIRRGD